MEISQIQADKIAYFIYENLDAFIDAHCKEYQLFLKERGKDFICGFNTRFSLEVFPIIILYN